MEELFLLEFYIEKIYLKCFLMKGFDDPDECKLNVDIDIGKFASIGIKQDEFTYDILEEADDDEFASECELLPDLTSLKSCTSKDNPYAEDEEKDPNPETLIEKSFKCGASILFANTFGNLKQIFKMFPMEIFVYTNTEQEKKSCVGVARVFWHAEFCELLDKQDGINRDESQLTWNTVEKLASEMSGTEIGEIEFGIRFTLLGKLVPSKFQNTLCRVSTAHSPYKQRVSYSCHVYGFNIRKRRETMHRTYQKNGYVEYLVKLIEQTIRKEYMDMMAQMALCNKTGDSKKDDCCPKKDDDCKCGLPCGKSASCGFKDPCQINPSTQTCECGGNNPTSGIMDSRCSAADANKKEQCTGPCNACRSSEELSGKQMLIYEGLNSMLKSVNNETHRRFCPEFLHKGTCATGACCSQQKK